MLPACRRAAFAARFAAAPSRCIARQAFQTIRIPIQAIRTQPQSIRAFSSIKPLLQQAEASDEIEATEGHQEYTRFDQLGQHGIISPVVVDTLTNQMNIQTMTEVQRMTLNHCIDGSDVIAQARTGTGKTLAFLLPIVQRILRDRTLERRTRGRADVDIRALVILPTRELAEQVAVEARKLVQNTDVRVQTAVGGSQKSFHLRQIQQQGCHILVGTPGRVVDILSDRSSGVTMDNIETFVLDEADRLLDIGFAPAIADIQSYMPSPQQKDRQTLMFSATVPKTVIQLVRSTLKPNFKFIRTLDPDENLTHDHVPQHVVFGQGLQNQIPIMMELAHGAIEKHKKDPANNMPFKAIVYFGSTAEVSLAFEAFSKMRDPDAQRSIFQPHPLDPCRLYQMHGKLTQQQRTRESEGFRRAQSAILFSSDVTARGMDFPNVSHVIQIGLPRSSDDYVHRVGRTGRAGKSGEGWLILNADERRDIAQKMRNSGVELKEGELITAKLDMTRAGQVPAHISKMLKCVEVGVKSVPYNVKASTYQALLGVLQQQNAARSKQSQVDMMNELAQFGWGMQEPPALSSRLIAKIGFNNTRGLRIEDTPREPRGDRYGDRGDRGGRFDDRQGGRGGFGSYLGGRDGGRDGDRSFGRRDQAPPPPSGKGVFGGGSGDAFDALGMDRDNDRRGGRSGRGGRR